MSNQKRIQASKTTPNITLYTFTMSPYAEKVHCYLQYKQLPFQCFYINPLRLKKDLPVGTQVPALTVGSESRAESSDIGIWLDEMFPDSPSLLPANQEERVKVLAIDQWVTHRLIPGNFRNYPGSGVNMRRVYNGWRLGQVLHKTSHGGIPWLFQASWPLVLSQLGFLKEMRDMTDKHLPLEVANQVLREEFIAHLAEGPFLGGMKKPTLADLGAYPQFVAPYMVGLHNAEEITEYPEIMQWIHNVRSHLEDMPPLIPSVVVKRRLPESAKDSVDCGAVLQG
ncbi:hypothetical protein A9Q99_16735 [Gammaproteobacteria bacterium 45_16_T64]|nr:hypothetical protein A9Q99_16735 [Gammaproteobacteria bacterium 45_16_T64]